MKVQSTGLGKMTLEAHFLHLRPENELFGEKVVALEMAIEATNPVHWHIKVHVEPKDVLRMVPMMLSLKVIWRGLRLLVMGIFSGREKKLDAALSVATTEVEKGAKQNG
jgi:hypothetical protein